MTTSKETSVMTAALTEQERETIFTFYSARKKKQPELLDEVCTSDWQDIPLGPGQANGAQGLKDHQLFYA